MAEHVVRTDAPVDGEVPEGLLEAFWAYERALMADDVPALDDLFAPGPGTMRGDAAGLLRGHEAIAAFRRGRGGAPKRDIAAVHVRVGGPDAALIVAELVPVAGGRGQQTQFWQRADRRWRVAAAHVSGPAPAIDSRIWRIAGTPLVAPTARGPLGGERVAVKDLFAVAGHRVGAGVPAYLDAATPSRVTASAVATLLAAGAAVTGIARTDEFAYSIAGLNPHYGTPPNAAVPGAVPGGSSSGPASAVALGQASIGLATDTAGSIRVPASYQGLWGLRTTHGAVPVDGLLPLAPSFDTVGWMTRDATTLAAVAEVGLAGRPGVAAPLDLVADPALLVGLDGATVAAFREGLDDLPASVRRVELGDMDALFGAFRAVQAFEAWAEHGVWLREHPDAVSGAVAERFRAARAVTRDEHDAARALLSTERDRIRDVLAGALLVMPAAASAAPQTTAAPAEVDRVRTATLRLTCVAGAAGLPVVAAPFVRVAGAPLGVALVGPADSDRALVHAAARLLA